MRFNLLCKANPILYLLFVFTIFFTSNSFAQPYEIKKLLNIAYGESDKQALDVYYPLLKKEAAPTIFMVHGGAWKIGDKASRAVIKNKVEHWVSKGFIFVSINYRMMPEIHPVEQAEDVKKALIFTQNKVKEWGGSPEQFILMGHSAGAHLISLISVRHDDTVKPWLGTVALDSAAYDVTKIMSAKVPLRFYKKAFGKDPKYWKEASPTYVISDKVAPFLAVCSSTRKDEPCTQARSFINKAKHYGSQARLLPVALSHRKINTELGKNNSYTAKVDEFLKDLHPSIGVLLTNSR